mmetsp:Transcript_88988/g.241360  ORF Transcript_88988/g.241360 Transcript_88988/m.241360 type:complete len:206 (+) Transcript_88988:299-916(+)
MVAWPAAGARGHSPCEFAPRSRLRAAPLTRPRASPPRGAPAGAAGPCARQRRPRRPWATRTAEADTTNWHLSARRTGAASPPGRNLATAGTTRRQADPDALQLASARRTSEQMAPRRPAATLARRPSVAHEAMRLPAAERTTNRGAPAAAERGSGPGAAARTRRPAARQGPRGQCGEAALQASKEIPDAARQYAPLAQAAAGRRG